ncbi:MAG: hypothetical protein JSW71_07640 [Gemmatimonadota bacterium]|nr:MAG: hypothetical protein JSW71_07640 [Gemmatimonadota bacterium]
MIQKIVLAIGLTLVVMYVIPFPIYGILSGLTGLQTPTEGSVALFMLSVLVIKLGVSVAFVLLFYCARDAWVQRWFKYALIWWGMFAVVELGQAITPDYSWLAAIGGIIAEAIYFPLAALFIARLLRPRESLDGSTL